MVHQMGIISTFEPTHTPHTISGTSLGTWHITLAFFKWLSYLFSLNWIVRSLLLTLANSKLLALVIFVWNSTMICIVLVLNRNLVDLNFLDLFVIGFKKSTLSLLNMCKFFTYIKLLGKVQRWNRSTILVMKFRLIYIIIYFV